MNVINRFFGLNQFSPEIQNLFLRFIVLESSIIFLLFLNNTFLFLYVLEIVDIIVLALLISVWQITQFLFDYPSGGLGDKFGQKIVLSASFVTFSLSFATFVWFPSFEGFFLAFILLGIAQSQLSGTLDSWLDNNYRVLAENSGENSINYGYSIGRIAVLSQVLIFLSIIIGGYLSFNFNRAFVISLSTIFSFTFPIILIPLMSDSQNDNSKSLAINEDKSSYFTILKQGITFSLNSRKVGFYIIGNVLISVGISIWAFLFLFLVYFGYTGSDLGAAIVRGSTFVSGALIGYFAASISKKMTLRDLPLVYSLTAILFCGGFFLLFLFNPWKDVLDWLGIIIALIIFFIGDIFGNFQNILERRALLELIPSHIRNSMYSLIPTFVTIPLAIMLPITGYLINEFGFAIGMLSPLFIVLLSVPFMLISVNANEKKIGN